MVLESVSNVNDWHKESHCWLTWESSWVLFNPSLLLPTTGEYINPKRNRGMRGQYKQVSEVLWYLKFLLLSSDVDILMREGLDSKTAGCDFALFFFFFPIFSTSCVRFYHSAELHPRGQLGPMFHVLVQWIPPMPLKKKLLVMLLDSLCRTCRTLSWHQAK